ncbi:MAG TPA: recombination mediator RecR [Actinomycetota bacterium]|nr:recombination mediator RecR [Actinomycetota bacterium]
MYAGPIQDLIDELARLPGIGPKSAQRVAFHLLKGTKEDAARLARAIHEAKEKVRFCGVCWNVSDQELCEYCRDPRRDQTILCVVQEAPDIVAVERTREYRGMYHVLQGAISPIEGIGPEDLRIAELLERLRTPSDGRSPVGEVIVATNPNIEGDATAMYLARLIGPLGVTVTRLASGMPVGGDLEYADEVTLGRALEGRRRLDG